jgi:NAD dependent epimerase/dehydratase family enzyme
MLTPCCFESGATFCQRSTTSLVSKSNSKQTAFLNAVCTCWAELALEAKSDENQDVFPGFGSMGMLSKPGNTSR